MQVRYANTPADAQALRRTRAWPYRLLERSSRAGYVFVSCLPATALLAWLGYQPLLVGGWCLVLLLMLFLQRRAGRPSLKPTSTTLTIDSDEVRATSEFGWTTLRWTAVGRCNATSEHLFIQKDRLNALVIPLAAFEDRQQADRFVQTAEGYHHQAALANGRGLTRNGQANDHIIDHPVPTRVAEPARASVSFRLTPRELRRHAMYGTARRRPIWEAVQLASLALLCFLIYDRTEYVLAQLIGAYVFIYLSVVSGVALSRLIGLVFAWRLAASIPEITVSLHAEGMSVRDKDGEQFRNWRAAGRFDSVGTMIVIDNQWSGQLIPRRAFESPDDADEFVHIGRDLSAAVHEPAAHPIVAEETGNPYQPPGS